MVFPRKEKMDPKDPPIPRNDPSVETESTGRMTYSTIAPRNPRIPRRNYNDHMLQLSQLSSRIRRLMVISILSIILFLIATFSVPTLIFFTISAVSMSLAGQAFYQQIQIQIDQHGILYYLPQSLQTLLTTTTIHEYMTDTSFYMENRYLLLYFIPGLSEQQLMNLIQQLPDHRRRFLLEQGQIARLVLPSFIRDRLYPLHIINEHIAETEIDHEREDEYNLATRRTNDDILPIPSDLVWSNNHHDNHGQNDEIVSTLLSTTSFPINVITQATSNDNSNPINPINEATEGSISNQSLPISMGNANREATSSNSDWNQDELVINAAVQSATNSFSRSMTQSALELGNTIISPSLLQRSSRLFGFMTFSTIAQWSWSLSSMMGYRRSIPLLSILVSSHRNNRNENNVHLDARMERNWISIYRNNTFGRLLASSTVFMGLSTGLLYYMRSYVRRSMQIDRERREQEEHERLSQQNIVNNDSDRMLSDSSKLE